MFLGKKFLRNFKEHFFVLCKASALNATFTFWKVCMIYLVLTNWRIEDNGI